MSTPDRLAELELQVTRLTEELHRLRLATGLYASDRDMDGPKGNPTAKFKPKAWQGASYNGKRFSECSPEFLDIYADALTWSADHPKEGRERYADFDRMDAKRARSWAVRKRSGWTPEPSDAPSFPGGDGGAAPSFDAPAFDSPGFEAPAFAADDEIPF